MLHDMSDREAFGKLLHVDANSLVSQALNIRRLTEMIAGTTKIGAGPVWLLGCCYASKEPTLSPQVLESIRQDFASRIWCTYRRRFPLLGDGGFTSDVGWGCTLRSGQMLVAEALSRQLMGRSWRRAHEGDSVSQRMLDILAWFQDSDAEAAPLSIHSLCASGKAHGVLPGKWLGPWTLCKSLETALSRAPQPADLRVHVVCDPGGGAPTLDVNRIRQTVFCAEALRSLADVPAAAGGRGGAAATLKPASSPPPGPPPPPLARREAPTAALAPAGAPSPRPSEDEAPALASRLAAAELLADAPDVMHTQDGTDAADTQVMDEAGAADATARSALSLPAGAAEAHQSQSVQHEPGGQIAAAAGWLLGSCLAAVTGVAGAGWHGQGGQEDADGGAGLLPPPGGMPAEEEQHAGRSLKADGGLEDGQLSRSSDQAADAGHLPGSSGEEEADAPVLVELEGPREPGPLLLLIPLTLGVGKVNPLYLPQLQRVLTYPHSVGIVGGRPGASLLFIGHQGDNLLYLDPHEAQPCLPLPAAAATYFCSTVRLMPMSSMDPSLAIGFHCPTLGEEVLVLRA